MQVQPQSGRGLVYITVYPEEYDPDKSYPLVVLLHGFGAHMYDLANLAPSLDARGYLYVCPNAPVPILIGQDMVGYSWKPPRDTGSPEQAIREQTQRIEEQLQDFFQEVMERYHVAPGRALLAGFSQGGGLTYCLGLPRPDLFAGLAVLSSWLPDPEALRGLLPAQRTQPVFIAHGLQDNPDRARRSRVFLEEEGYAPDYHEYDMAHEISAEVLADLVPWMRRVLPPDQEEG